MTTQTNNEVTTQKTQLPMAQAAPQAQEILNSDIVIPRLYLMQGLSDAVAERKKSPDGKIISMGQMIRSNDLEILADPESPMKIIPLKYTSEWIEKEVVGKNLEYRGSHPRTALTEDLPWDYFRDQTGKESATAFPGATQWRRVKVINVFALLPGDVDSFQADMKKAMDNGDLPDLNKTLLPIVISFRSTSFNAGKEVATFFARVRDAQKMAPQTQAYQYQMELSCFLDKNDKGSFYVYKTGKISAAAKEHVAVAKTWYENLVNMTNIQVASEEGESVDAPTEKEATAF